MNLAGKVKGKDRCSQIWGPHNTGKEGTVGSGKIIRNGKHIPEIPCKEILTQSCVAEWIHREEKHGEQVFCVGNDNSEGQSECHLAILLLYGIHSI